MYFIFSMHYIIVQVWAIFLLIINNYLFQLISFTRNSMIKSKVSKYDTCVRL